MPYVCSSNRGGNSDISPLGRMILCIGSWLVFTRTDMNSSSMCRVVEARSPSATRTPFIPSTKRCSPTLKPWKSPTQTKKQIRGIPSDTHCLLSSVERPWGDEPMSNVKRFPLGGAGENCLTKKRVRPGESGDVVVSLGEKRRSITRRTKAASRERQFKKLKAIPADYVVLMAFFCGCIVFTNLHEMARSVSMFLWIGAWVLVGLIGGFIYQYLFWRTPILLNLPIIVIVGLSFFAPGLVVYALTFVNVFLGRVLLRHLLWV